MKKYTSIILIFIVIIIGFYTGFYLYKIKHLNNDNNINIGEETIEDECTILGELEEKGQIISTNNDENKVSPNCIITLKIYYKKCGHLVEKKEIINNTEVNLTQSEIQEKFNDWELQKFTSKEIVLYKEVNEYCGEHYMLKEKDGYVAVFKLDENKNEEFIENTDIATKYLTENDYEKIKNKIYVYSKKELSKTLEDFE